MAPGRLGLDARLTIHRTVRRGGDSQPQAPVPDQTSFIGWDSTSVGGRYQRKGLERLRLLDHLIRPCQERRRDRQAEGLRSFEVDDELELRGLLDRKIAGLGAT